MKIATRLVVATTPLVRRRMHFVDPSCKSIKNGSAVSYVQRIVTWLISFVGSEAGVQAGWISYKPSMTRYCPDRKRPRSPNMPLLSPGRRSSEIPAKQRRIVIWLQGYTVFLKGEWSVATFIFNYGIVSVGTYCIGD